LLDNAFTQIADWNQAQRLADDWRVEKIYQKLDPFAQRYCPVIACLGAAHKLFGILPSSVGADCVVPGRELGVVG